MLSHPPSTIPADWSPPTNPALERKYGDTEQHRNPQHIADFFHSHKELTYVFIAADPKSHLETIESGPSLQAVTEMLQREPQIQEANTTLCDQTWDAVTLILEELDLLNDFRYILVWRLSDEDCLEFSHSHHFNRKTAWQRVRFHIPSEQRDEIPTKPPSSAQKAKNEVTPAPPTTTVPYPFLSKASHWPTHHAYSFNRDPASRWNRAYSLIQHNTEPSEKTDDESTTTAYRFLKSVVENPRCRRLHRMRMPSMFFANKLRIGDTDKRLELECRLLTEQPIEEIAEIFSVKPKTVKTYHDTFYDVRSRLSAKTYILKKVIGKGTGATSYTMESYAKFLAWRGGIFLFEESWRYLKSGGSELTRLTSGDEILDPFAERLLLLFQALNLSDDAQTQKILLRMESRLPNRFDDVERSCSFLGVLGQIEDESCIVVETRDETETVLLELDAA